MKKESRVKITSAVLALLMTTSGVALKSNARAESGTESTVITVYNADTNETETIVYTKAVPILPSDEKISEEEISIEERNDFFEYTVVDGDNASIISKKMCKKLGIPVTSKYWPVIAYLNNYPRTIHKGDILIYPNNEKMLERIYTILKETGWIKRYVKNNQVYSRNSAYILDDVVTAGMVFDEMYGEGASKNTKLFNAFLEYIGQSGNFTPETILRTGDEYFTFTEDVPTLTELNEFKNQKKR